MKKFEYKILETTSKGFWGIRIDYEELNHQLNELGRAGWEVVTQGADGMHTASKKAVIIILKREIN